MQNFKESGFDAHIEKERFTAQWQTRKSCWNGTISTCTKCGGRITSLTGDFDFCPVCGRAMTEKAWDILRNRLKENAATGNQLHDTDQGTGEKTVVYILETRLPNRNDSDVIEIARTKDLHLAKEIVSLGYANHMIRQTTNDDGSQKKEVWNNCQNRFVEVHED